MDCYTLKNATFLRGNSFKFFYKYQKVYGEFGGL